LYVVIVDFKIIPSIKSGIQSGIERVRICSGIGSS